MAEEKYKQITYMDMKKDEEVNMLLAHGNQVLKELGFTEHSRKHAAKVAETAGRILKELGYGDREIRLSKIAGYMHDIGNGIHRHDHAQSLELDDEMCTVMDYFEIFLKRTMMCKRASEVLGCRFKLVANGNKVC